MREALKRVLVSRRLVGLLLALCFLTTALPQTQGPRTVSAAPVIDPNAYYKIVVRHSGKVLDVSGVSTADGANVQQWSDTGGTNQQWRIVDVGSGYYKFVARHSGKVLDVANVSTADGANVQQWSDTGGSNQQWRFIDATDGYYRIAARHSGKVLDVNGRSTADGANVLQWTDASATNQQWRLVLVGSASTPTRTSTSGTVSTPTRTSTSGPGPSPTPSTGTRPSPGCGRTRTLQNGTHTIQSGGVTRSFILRIPDGYNNTRPHRLAFGFHWRGGTADQVASGGADGFAWAYYGMLSQDTDRSTIFVAPQGLNNGWGNSNGQDVTFTDDMIRLIQNDLCVDMARLFSVGFSWGGGMSYALACARPTVFRAVAVIAGGVISGCSGGTGPIAYLGIHGISDSVLNISGGRSMRDRFVRNNGYALQNPPEPAVGSRTHICTKYQGGNPAYPVEWCAFDGGHQQGPVDGCAGCESGARSWVKPEVWKFFTQF